MNHIDNTSKTRITSIDALRAFALFGIILVHSIGGFCIDTTNAVNTPLDTFFVDSISLLLKGKCATIFGILFGISFYIILRKPNYPTSKFVWRCFLLFLIGLLNKFFYKPDALMIYGMMGMVLASIRNLKTKHILCFSVMCFFLSFVTRIVTYYVPIIPSDMVVENYRYEYGHSTFDIIRYWPTAVIWYLEHTSHGGFFNVLGKFALGYWIGRKGFVEIMDERVNKKIVLKSCVAFIVLLALHEYLMDGSSIIYTSADHFIKIAVGVIGALFYSTLFIWIYNHVRNIKPLLVYMESYGKLGLSNYTSQGVILVFLLSDLGLGFKYHSITFYVCTAFVFYIIQLIFSNMWLKKFKNGPLEYLWRCATERKWLPLLKK